MARSYKSRLRGSSTVHPVHKEYREIAHYWMLFILVRLGAHKKMMNETQYEDEVLEELGLSRFTECDSGKFDVYAARKQIAGMYKHVENSAPTMPEETQLARNIKRLGRAIGLASYRNGSASF